MRAPSSPRRTGHRGDTESPDDETLDRTPWPINRMSYQDLKVAELDAIERLFAARNDAPLLMKWAMQHTRGGAFRRRLLVISALRVWLLQRKKPLRTTVERVSVHQLIHVTKIVVLRASSASDDGFTDSTLATGTCTTTSIKIHFESSTGTGDVDLTTLHIDPGAHTESIARLLQRQLHALRLAFPSGIPPSIRFPPRCHWQEFFNVDSSQTQVNSQGAAAVDEEEEQHLRAQFTAISAAYRAFCDDLAAPYRESVMTRLQECLCALSCVDFAYCLALPRGDASNQHLGTPGANDHHFDAHNAHELGIAKQAAVAVMRCFGAGPPSRAELARRETQALARALGQAGCVENVVIRQLQVKDAAAAALFQSLLSPSSSVQGLALNDAHLSASALRILQNAVLQSTIQHERHTPTESDQHRKPGLRRLDLSSNRFSQKMAVELAVTLELLPLGLELLQLERCALSSAASCLLLSSLGANAAFAGSLRELNLSGNHLGLEGTKTLAAWLASAFALQQLDVSRTAMELNCFSLALQQNSILSESALAHLDISYNRMRSQASQALGLVLSKTRSLATLVLRGMARFHVARVTVGRKHNSIGESVASKWRSKREKRGVAISTSGWSNAPHTRGLKREHLRNILSPMFSNTGRVAPCMVDLSENDLRGKKAELLAQLIDAAPTIARHSLRLDHACLHDKASLLLLHSIRGCSTLNSLSLEGNGFVKRSAQRKRVVEAQRGGVQHQSGATEVDLSTTTSSLERAAARALSLLVGDPKNAVQNSTSLDIGVPSAVSSTPRLLELCLKSYSSFVFGSPTIAAVVDALAITTSLRVLDVAGNECGDALAQALGRALPLNSSLRTLFWDDNCTSVDGFFAFYAGLLPNRSLTMVQMPIQDTRRILEGQKNPPREKLFSVLGKIFKVTERNQTCPVVTRPSVYGDAQLETSAVLLREEVDSSMNNQAVHETLTPVVQDQREEEKPTTAFDVKSDLVEPRTSNDQAGVPRHGDNNALEKPANSVSTPTKPSMSGIPRCPSPDVAARPRGSKTWRPGDEFTGSSSVGFRSRYPSTMHSWDLGGGGGRKSTGTAALYDSIDFTAQWEELNALTASFTAT